MLAILFSYFVPTGTGIFLAMLILFFIVGYYISRYVPILWNQGLRYIEGFSTPNIIPQRPQMLMDSACMPFYIRLRNEQPDPKSLCFVMASSVSYRIVAFWGVVITSLNQYISLPWTDLNEALESNVFFDGHFEQCGFDQRAPSHEQKIWTLEIPSGPVNLGDYPRAKFPLVIIMVQLPSTPEEAEEPIALTTIVHIRDNICPLPTLILGQYAKVACGRVMLMQTLYTPFADAEPGEEEPDQLCIICHVFPISRALLPCRHTCVCGSCFDRIENCPLCRTPIGSYFIVREELNANEVERQPSRFQVMRRWLLDHADVMLGLR